MITETCVEIARGGGVINKSGQVVNDKTNQGMQGTIPNRVPGFHEYTFHIEL